MEKHSDEGYSKEEDSGEKDSDETKREFSTYINTIKSYLSIEEIII